MNTQEKELKHCTACNQMTNHSGETCLKHTPDTECEKEFEKIPRFWKNYPAQKYSIEYVQANVVHTLIKSLLSSRDTYWKEREAEAYKRGYIQGGFDSEMNILNVTPPDTELKKWFEANYLDGDEVQEGQTLASSECLDALSSRDTYWKERVREELGEINFLEGIVGHNNRDIVLENYRKLRDTLLDNLK